MFKCVLLHIKAHQQYTATRCDSLHRTATVVRHIATHQQHVATRGNTLQQQLETDSYALFVTPPHCVEEYSILWSS